MHSINLLSNEHNNRHIIIPIIHSVFIQYLNILVRENFSISLQKKRKTKGEYFFYLWEIVKNCFQIPSNKCCLKNRELPNYPNFQIPKWVKGCSRQIHIKGNTIIHLISLLLLGSMSSKVRPKILSNPRIYKLPHIAKYQNTKIIIFSANITTERKKPTVTNNKKHQISKLTVKNLYRS